MMRMAMIAGALGLAGAAMAPQPASAQASPLRKVDAEGIGNCVFSPQELPKGGEGTAPYKAIRSDFNEGESVHIRCYWPKKLAAYRAAGKIFNEIRDKNQYSYALYWMAPGVDGAPPYETFMQDMASADASEAMAWDQQRFDLYDDHPDCDVRVQDDKLKSMYGVTSPHRCLSLSAYARKQRQTPAGAGLETFRFCFRQYVEVADDTVTWSGRDSSDPLRLRTHRTTENNIRQVVIARGCFNYHLKG